MSCVGDLQTLHTISVSPLCEMFLEGTSTPVAEVTADLAFVFNAKSMQFVEPVRDRLAIRT